MVWPAGRAIAARGATYIVYVYSIYIYKGSSYLTMAPTADPEGAAPSESINTTKAPIIGYSGAAAARTAHTGDSDVTGRPRGLTPGRPVKASITASGSTFHQNK